MTGAQTVLLIIGLEHVMLLLKLLISAAIPDVPQHVAQELAKVEYKRREVERLISNQRLAELQVRGDVSGVRCEVTWNFLELRPDGQQGLPLAPRHRH